MSIKFRCSACQHGIKAPDDAAGRTLKCPECGEKQKVPAAKSAASEKAKAKPSSRSKKKEEDSDAFLNSLDFDRIADAEVRLCQKCAAEIPEGETACPECGFDPQQLTEAGRKRMKMSAQGIDPSTFYEKTWKDPFSFAMAHKKHIVKSGMLMAFFFLMAVYCTTFVMWVATTPPFSFWMLLTVVAVMIPVGWLMVQHLEILKLTLARKDEFKKIPFDFALCGMYGVKFLAWVIIYGLPFWILFGGLGALLNNMEVPFGMVIGLSLGLITLLLFAPQALSHLAMPVEQAGWFFPKIVPTLGVSFLPGLVWFALFLVVNLPVIGGAVLIGVLGGEQIQEFVRVSQIEAKQRRGALMLKLAEGASSESRKQELISKFTDDAAIEVPAKSWSSLAMPLSIGAFCFLYLGFSSVVVARSNGLFTACLRKGLDLVSQSKEVVWERKEKQEKVRTRRTTQPAPPGPRFLAGLGDVSLLAVVGALLAFIVIQILNVIFESAGVQAESQLAFIIQISSVAGMILLVFSFYFISLEAGDDQATTIKKAMGLYVCADDLQPISMGQSALRFVVFLFLSSGLTLGVGNLLCMFREDKKTLHDLLTGTQVRLDKPAAKKASSGE